MKTIISIVTILFLILTISCNKNNNDECYLDGTNCNNHGSCNDGQCECLDGYDGKSCENLILSKYIGIYEMNIDIDSAGNFLKDTIVVSRGNLPTELSVRNEFGFDLFPTEDANDFDIPVQVKKIYSENSNIPSFEGSVHGSVKFTPASNNSSAGIYASFILDSNELVLWTAEKIE